LPSLGRRREESSSKSGIAKKALLAISGSGITISEFSIITSSYSIRSKSISLGAFLSALLLQEIADYVYKKVKARGVLVVIKARHMCMEMRGAKSYGVETLSSAIRGSFEKRPHTKAEALKLIT
jgi:GTP cyclohydrolase I